MSSPADPPSCVVRPMRLSDVAGIAALAAGEPTAPHWPPAEYRRMMQVIAEFPGRRGAWVLLVDQPQGLATGKHVRGAGQSVALGEAGLPLIGFAMASHVAGSCDLEAVVVHTAWRGKRLGAFLVQAAVAWGEELSASRLQLEVRASNVAAVRLYRRIGFTSDGVRPGYYSTPDEDAVLMSLPLQTQGGPR